MCAQVTPDVGDAPQLPVPMAVRDTCAPRVETGSAVGGGWLVNALVRSGEQITPERVMITCGAGGGPVRV
ncbi:hypothetical protein GCM10028783_15810 [Modestobacter muralis]